MNIGQRVKQTHSGRHGVVKDLMTTPQGQECVWVLFDGDKLPKMRIVQVMEPA